jgi:DNA-binding NtrC family response regulator
MDTLNILIVDDEAQMRSAMDAVLTGLGHVVTKCNTGKEAVEALGKSSFDLIISDMKMPEMTGLELLAVVKESYSRTPFVMITAYGTISQAVEAMRNGAFDFLPKPFSGEDLERIIAKLQAQVAQPATPSATASKQRTRSVAIVTQDVSFRSILEIAANIAPSSASVLVQGESGTGKELIAKYIHTCSGRSGNFVAVNCAALPENLLESELFGHEKGSFTGALNTKIGKFELANGGTILLDEISEMDLGLQSKLLRVLQEREVDRVGSQRPIQVDVRVVATTNRDLRQYVREGKFREDLFYRLNVIPLYIPALRDRSGDVHLLVEHFVRNYSTAGIKKIPADLMRKLEKYSWPGNIRELQNACERAVLMATGDTLEERHFFIGSDAQAAVVSDNSMTIRSGLSVAEAEKLLIYETLKSTSNNKTKAAELLGISIRTLRNKLHEYGDTQGD